MVDFGFVVVGVGFCHGRSWGLSQSGWGCVACYVVLEVVVCTLNFTSVASVDIVSSDPSVRCLGWPRKPIIRSSCRDSVMDIHS